MTNLFKTFAKTCYRFIEYLNGKKSNIQLKLIGKTTLNICFKVLLIFKRRNTIYKLPFSFIMKLFKYESLKIKENSFKTYLVLRKDSKINLEKIF